MIVEAEMTKLWRSTLIAAVLFILPTVPEASAGTVSVESFGVDTVNCGAKKTPCRSISRAIENAHPGDAIVVGRGVYGDLNSNGVLGEPGEEVAPGCDCMIHVDKNVEIRSTDGAAVTLI